MSEQDVVLDAFERNKERRIAFSSHAPNIPTGFGRVINALGSGFGRAGYDVHCLGWQYRGQPLRAGLPYTIHPASEDNFMQFGTQSARPFIERIKPQIYISLADWFVFGYMPNMMKEIGSKCKWVWYVPVDSEPLSPEFEKILNNCEYRVAMAEYGQRIMARKGLLSTLLPHGVDTETYKPLPQDIIDERKKQLGIEDKFVVGFVGMNQFRKQPGQLVRAFAKFAEGKNDVKLALHMPMIPNVIDQFVGYQMPLHLIRWGIRDKVIVTKSNDIYVHSAREVVLNMNMYDLHCSCTGGEGFGLTALETACCGTPNAITNCSTSPELLNYDWKKAEDKVYDDIINTGMGMLVPLKMKWTHGHGADFSIVDSDKMADAMQYAYDNPYELKKMGKAARKHALTYDWRIQIEKWFNFIDSIYDEEGPINAESR